MSGPPRYRLSQVAVHWSDCDAKGCDAAVTFCSFLIVRENWTLSQIARALSVPELAIKQCIRNGESSVALRRQLVSWLQEHEEFINARPGFYDELVASAIRRTEEGQGGPRKTSVGRLASPRAVVALSPSPSMYNNNNEYFDDDSALATLDPKSREHFDSLRTSVGQNFMSILCEPEIVAPASNSWGTWLGNFVSDPMKYTTSSPVHATPQYSGGQLSRGRDGSSPRSSRRPSAAGGIDGELHLSSEAMLADFTLPNDFSEYLNLVSAAYGANRDEINMETERGGIPLDAQLPWPSEVPELYFLTTFDVKKEMMKLHLPYRHHVAVSALKEESKSQISSRGRVEHSGSSLEAVTGKVVRPVASSSGDATRTAPSDGLVSTERVVTEGTFAEDDVELETQINKRKPWSASVDECLVRHAQSKSKQFFEISDQFSKLGTDATEVMESVAKTRSGVTHSGEKTVNGFLTVAQLYRQREHLSTLEALTRQVEGLFKKMAYVENWVVLPERDIAELPSVVRAFCDIQEIVLGGDSRGSSGVAPPLIVDRIASLSEFRARVVGVKCALLAFLREDESAVSVEGSLWERVTQERVLYVFEASHLMGTLGESVQLYQSTLEKGLWAHVVEGIVSSVLTSGKLGDEDADHFLSLTQNRMITPEQRREVLRYTSRLGFLQFLDLLGVVSDAVLDFTTQAAHMWERISKEMASKGKEMSAALSAADRGGKNMNSLYTAGVTIFVIMVKERETATTTLSPRQFETLMSTCFSFLCNFENQAQAAAVGSHSPRASDASKLWAPGNVLKLALKEQGKHFLYLTHEKNMEKVRSAVMNELWEPQGRIDSMFQEHLDTITSSTDAAVEEFHTLKVENMGRATHPSVVPKAGGRNGGSAGAADSSSKPSGEMAGEEHDTGDGACSKLYISSTPDDGGRVIGNSLLILIQTLYEYDRNLGRYPYLDFDTVTIIYKILEQYVSQCANCLLNAEAVEQGKLTKITIQYLALASQCMGLLCDVIPLLQTRLRRLFPNDKLTPFINGDLGRAQGNSLSSRNAFLEKIVSVTLSKVDAKGTFSGAAWNESGHAWVMAMLKEAARLLRDLPSILPPTDLNGVMIPVISFLADKIRDRIRSVPKSSMPNVQASIESDVAIFHANVAKFGYDVLQCVSIKNVPDALRVNVSTAEVNEAHKAEILAWFLPA